jgi:hypothetical protein
MDTRLNPEMTEAQRAELRKQHSERVARCTRDIHERWKQDADLKRANKENNNAKSHSDNS